MKPTEYDEAEVNRQYDDALNRSANRIGPRARTGTIVRLAREGGYRTPPRSVGGPSQTVIPFDLSVALPVYSPQGMSRREFAGPPIGSAHMFPLNALSLLTSLGGVGKTTTIVKICSHIAAGRPFGFCELGTRRVLVFCVEESQEELNRKFGAGVHEWTDQERDRAAENLRLFSCLDRDARLTLISGRQVIGSAIADEVIRAAKEFDAEVIVLDHLQGFVSGDLNNSDTATALAVELNKIVAATGAAVVLTAHTTKANINAQEVLDGFTTGTLAFENAARQVIGVIPIPKDDAKNLHVEGDKSDYLMMGMPKNSYGPGRQKAYLRKVYVPDFHTITVEPFVPPGGLSIASAADRVKAQVLDHIKQNPGSSPAKLDGLSGKSGPFKAPRRLVRDALRELVDEGLLKLRTLTTQDWKALGLPHQTKQVYEHVEAPVVRQVAR